MCLRTTIPCYPPVPLAKEGPVARMLANGVANFMSEATVPLMGRSVISVRAITISKQFVIQRLQQSSQEPALTERSHNNNMPGSHQPAATMAKEEANNSSRRRHLRSSLQSRKHMWLQ